MSNVTWNPKIWYPASENDPIMYIGSNIFHKTCMAMKSEMSLAFLQGELTTGTWEEQTECLQFADFKFNVTHHRLQQKEPSPDLTGTEKDEAGGKPAEDAPTKQESTANVDAEEGSVVRFVTLKSFMTCNLRLVFLMR